MALSSLRIAGRSTYIGYAIWRRRWGLRLGTVIILTERYRKTGRRIELKNCFAVLGEHKRKLTERVRGKCKTWSWRTKLQTWKWRTRKKQDNAKCKICMLIDPTTKIYWLRSSLVERRPFLQCSLHSNSGSTASCTNFASSIVSLFRVLQFHVLYFQYFFMSCNWSVRCLHVLHFHVLYVGPSVSWPAFSPRDFDGPSFSGLAFYVDPTERPHSHTKCVLIKCASCWVLNGL